MIIRVTDRYTFLFIIGLCTIINVITSPTDSAALYIGPVHDSFIVTRRPHQHSSVDRLKVAPGPLHIHWVGKQQGRQQD